MSFNIELLAKSLSGMLPEVVNVLPGGVEPSILSDEFPDVTNANYAANPNSSEGRSGAILVNERNGEIASVTGPDADAVLADQPDKTGKKYDLPVVFEYFKVTDSQLRGLNSLNKLAARNAVNEIAMEGVNRITRLANRMKSQAFFNEGVVANDTSDPVLYSYDWGIPAGNLETLTGNNVWGGTTDDPPQDIIDNAQAVAAASGQVVNKLYSDAALPMTFATRSSLATNYGDMVATAFVMNRKVYLPGLDMEWQIVKGQYTNRAGTATNYATASRLILVASTPGNPVGKLEWGAPRGLESLGMSTNAMTSYDSKQIAIWAVPDQSRTSLYIYCSAAVLAVLKKPKQVAVIRVA